MPTLAPANTGPINVSAITPTLPCVSISASSGELKAVPVSIPEFRLLARKAGAVVVIIDGKHFYERVLPLVPKEGAA